MKITISRDSMVAGAYNLDFETEASSQILWPLVKKFQDFHLMCPGVNDAAIRSCADFMYRLYGKHGAVSVEFTSTIGLTVHRGYIEVIFDLDGYKHKFVYTLQSPSTGHNATSPHNIVVKGRHYRTIFKYYICTKDGERSAPDGYPVCFCRADSSFFMTAHLWYNHKNPTHPTRISLHDTMTTNDDEGIWESSTQYKKDGRRIEDRLLEAGYFDDALDDTMREFIWEMI